MARNDKTQKLLLGVRKTIKDFMMDEDGFVSKGALLQAGLTTLAGAAVLGSFSEALAATHVNTVMGHVNVSAPHANVPAATWVNAAGGTRYLSSSPTAVSVTSHVNTNSHVNHANG